jgi:hypothetical protein
MFEICVSLIVYVFRVLLGNTNGHYRRTDFHVRIFQDDIQMHIIFLQLAAKIPCLERTLYFTQINKFELTI